MLQRTLLLALIAVSPALSLPQNVGSGEPIKKKAERFVAGYIEVPAGYKTERVGGPDFHVEYVIPEGTQVSKTRIMLGVYTGDHPSFAPPAEGVKTKGGTFGGRRLKWHIWKAVVEGSTVHRREALVRDESGQVLWHIFMTAPDARRMRELMVILNSYRAG